MTYQREITKKILKSLNSHEIIFLLGTRQTGKTTLAKILLNQSEIPEQNKFYYDLEDKQYRNLFNLSENTGIELLKNIFRAEGIDINKENLIVFDEVQYLKDPSNLLKLIHDTLPKLKIIATGSSSLQIKNKFSDSLAGRKNVFVIQPLSFREFLLFKSEQKLINVLNIYDEEKELFNIKAVIENFNSQFLFLFNEYLTFGGYPEVVLIEDRKQKIEKLKSIADSYIQKDIREIANIENIEAYNNLINFLAVNSGNLINISTISSTLKISVETVNKYINLLAETYIIGKLKPFFTNKSKELSKNYKIYFKDTGVRNLQLLNFNPIENRVDSGIIYENYIYNKLENYKEILEQIHFYRTQTKTEIDFLKQDNDKIEIIEVKSSDFTKNIRAFTEFEKKYNDNYSKMEKTIVNKSNFDFKFGIKYLPAYLF